MGLLLKLSHNALHVLTVRVSVCILFPLVLGRTLSTGMIDLGEYRRGDGE